MTLADLYLIGAPKAGTTSVASWLSDHPDVFWSTPKEPYYWAADYPRMRALYGFETRAQYQHLFESPAAHRATVRGDGSTTYLYSREAVAAIANAVPEARFIVCVRDPIDLLVSYHRTQVVAGNDDEPDFGVAWRRSLQGRPPSCDPLDTKLVDYPLVGGLGAAFDRLVRTVARHRVHPVLFDDLMAHPTQTWRALADFVGIDPTLKPSFEVRNASNKMLRASALRRIVHRPPTALQRPVRGLRQWSRTTSMPGVSALKRVMWRAEAHPVAPPEVRADVAEHLREDIDHLSVLLERDLGHWARVSTTKA